MGSVYDRELPAGGKTASRWAVGGQLSDVVGVADTLKVESAEAVAELHRMGLKVACSREDNAV